MVRLAERQRLVRRDEYERMVDAGLFRGEHVELIRGIIVRMSPQNAAHALVIQILNRLLVPALLGRADVRVQLPFAAGDLSLPEPDLALVAVGRFGEPHPSRAFSLIEVADSSLSEDRGEKAELYCLAGVPEYWVVNIPDGTIEVHTDASRGAFTRVTPYRAGQALAPVAFPDVLVRVDDLFSSDVAAMGA
jgi:Uma2 family endonuclease